MLKNKKMIILLSTFIMLFSTTSVFAETNSDITLTKISEEEYLKASNENIGLSEIEPNTDLVIPTGTSIPSKSKNLKYDTYEFSGKANHSNLYTDYSFYGTDTYYLKVVNDHSSDLRIKLKSRFKTYEDITIPGNSTEYYTITSIDSSQKFYILFYAPLKASGFIRDK